MKTLSNRVVLFASKFSGKTRMITFILTLVLFVLAAGAPSAVGTIGG